MSTFNCPTISEPPFMFLLPNQSLLAVHEVGAPPINDQDNVKDVPGATGPVGLLDKPTIGVFGGGLLATT